MTRTIYLDMDGVLADFDGALAARGLPGGTDYFQRPRDEWAFEDHQRDARVKEIMAGEGFWPSLAALPGANAIVSVAATLVGPGNVYILTALPRGPLEAQRRIAEEKKAWAALHLGFDPRQVLTCMRAEKAGFSTPDRILVDDLRVNCAEWAAAGGFAICHTGPLSTICELRDRLQPAELTLSAAIGSMRHTAAQKAMNLISSGRAGMFEPPTLRPGDHGCGCDFCTVQRTDERAHEAWLSEPVWTGIDFASVEGPREDPPALAAFLNKQSPALGLPTDAAARKATPVYSGVMRYFPDALAEIARVSKAGNDQHNPGQPLHWSKGKSTDHDNCVARHLLDAGTIDTDGQRHRAKVAWRSLASLQIELEAEAAGMTYEAYIAKLENDYA